MASHSITSARNGLKIAIPLRPYGILQRFSSKGDNELIFTDPRRVSVGAEAAQESKLKISESEAVEAPSESKAARRRAERRASKEVNETGQSNAAEEGLA